MKGKLEKLRHQYNFFFLLIFESWWNKFTRQETDISEKFLCRQYLSN